MDIRDNLKIADITIEGKRVKILEGGKGGLGNTFFKSSTNRAPAKAKDGKMGEKLRVALNLKTISDLSLVGFPNVGKSSIITKITNSKAEVGNYAFTTLNPNIGVLKGDVEDYLIADIPGLIEGSSSGKGLGHKFLKHIERSKFLIEVLDLSCKDLDELKAQHSILIKELESYNKELPLRIKLIVLNKLDLCLFVNDIEVFDLQTFGPKIENHPLFPEKCNVTLAKVINKNLIKVKVWERGAGLTKACGTAACATAVAANINNLVEKTTDIEFALGNLTISIDERNSIHMKGPVSDIKNIDIKL